MSGIGGVTGCIIGGVLTERGTPQYAYLIQSITGLIVATIGFNLTKECEEDKPVDENAIQEIREEITFMNKVK